MLTASSPAHIFMIKVFLNKQKKISKLQHLRLNYFNEFEVLI